MALLKIQVDYDNLLILDELFLSWVKQQSGWESVFRKLMYIQKSSNQRKNQNFILSSNAEKPLRFIFEKDYIKASCHVINIINKSENQESLTPEDIVTKKIFSAIHIASENYPYRSYIFTSPEKAQMYLKNEHYIKAKSISVKSGSEAINIIDRYFRQFCSVKELARMGKN